MSKYELEKNKRKVEELCSEMKSKGHAVNLKIENISADHLSMETLLSMTSKRAGEWFKEELRELGGLDHLVRTMNDIGKISNSTYYRVFHGKVSVGTSENRGYFDKM